eukprot:14060214-Ditylum_brightwellii.AAC.1
MLNWHLKGIEHCIQEAKLIQEKLKREGKWSESVATAQYASTSGNLSSSPRESMKQSNPASDLCPEFLKKPRLLNNDVKRLFKLYVCPLHRYD